MCLCKRCDRKKWVEKPIKEKEKAVNAILSYLYQNDSSLLHSKFIANKDIICKKVAENLCGKNQPFNKTVLDFYFSYSTNCPAHLTGTQDIIKKCFEV